MLLAFLAVVLTVAAFFVVTKIIIPKGQSVVEAGDTVIVVTTRSGLSDIKDILE